MKKYYGFISFWLLDSLLLYLATVVYPAAYTLGTFRLSVFWAAVVAGFIWTVLVWFSKPIATIVKLKVPDKMKTFFYLLANFVALWLVFAIKQALDTGDVIIKEAFRSTLRNLFPYIWVGLLVYFIALPGFFLLIIPGVILAVHLSMSHLVLVDENIKGLNAVIKSMDYVKGKAFWVIGNFIVLTILALVTFVPIMLLFAGFGEFFYGIAISLISVLISPIPWIFAFLMFRALKAAKGSYIPAPTRKRRIKFALLALIGFVALPVIFGGLLLSTLNPNEQLQKARDSKRESDILMMSNALNTYFTDNQEYPASLNELTPRYFSYVPVDPLSGKSYTYSATTGTGENYKLCANEMEVSEKFCKDSFIPSRIYDTVK